MNDDLKSKNSLVISYLTLRKIIGLLGISFPFVLSFGAMIFFQTGLQSSVSKYYHTGMGDVFVGILCVIGFFLLSYKGYDRDYIAGRLGCIFAVGAALFPTHQTPDDNDVSGYIHLAFAGLFFITLIYFSLFLFTKTDPEGTPTRRKLQRNKVYKVCGYIMSFCILLVGIYFLLPSEVVSPINVYDPIFWLEAVAVVAFGISWLTKGEAILKDVNIA